MRRRKEARSHLQKAAGLQNKKEAEEQAQRELNELFAQAIKQPKVPVGMS